MKRNNLIWITLAMSVFIVGASISLLETDYWGWAILFMFYGMVHITLFIQVNETWLWKHLIGMDVKEESPLKERNPHSPTDILLHLDEA